MAAVAAGPWPPQAFRSGKKRCVRNALSWALLALGLVVWAFTFRPTQLGGPATFVVVSGDSMEPTLSDGDLVVLRAQNEYAVGDIATFAVPDDEPGAGTLIIHRLVDVEGDAFVPQGDNRERADEWRPTGDDVKGTLWFHVPRGGTVLMTALQPSVFAALAGGGATMWFLLRDSKPGRGDSQNET